MIIKYLELFLKPKKFIEKHQNISYRYALLFFAVPYFSLAILYDAVIIFQNALAVGYFEAILTIVVYSLTAIIFPFLFSGLTHLSAILLGTKKTHKETFLVSTTALTVVLFYFALGIFASIILMFTVPTFAPIIMGVLGFFAFVHCAVMLYLGFRQIHKFRWLKSIGGATLPFILLFMITFVLSNTIL